MTNIILAKPKCKSCKDGFNLMRGMTCKDCGNNIKRNKPRKKNIELPYQLATTKQIRDSRLFGDDVLWIPAIVHNQEIEQIKNCIKELSQQSIDSGSHPILTDFDKILKKYKIKIF